MEIAPNKFYHLYNRSINKEILFPQKDNYLYFLKKTRSLIKDAEIVCYCLMPTHFHLLIYTNEEVSNFHKSIGVLLRSYTSGINKRYKRTGSLFQQHTKAKELTSDEYVFICFHYIHQNPMSAGLVEKMEEWEFSSFRDYIKIRNGTLCNQELAKELISIDANVELFYKESYKVIAPEKRDLIFSHRNVSLK